MKQRWVILKTSMLAYDLLWAEIPETLVVLLSFFPFSFFFFTLVGCSDSTAFVSSSDFAAAGTDRLPTTVRHVGLPGTWYLATSLASSSNFTYGWKNKSVGDRDFKTHSKEGKFLRFQGWKPSLLNLHRMTSKTKPNAQFPLSANRLSCRDLLS